MNTPRGFAFAGLNCGIKFARKDLALIYSEVPCAAAGAFTRNKASSAAVRDAMGRLPSDSVRAIVLNSGNANALTGAAGDADVLAIRTAMAGALGVSPASILTGSTGVIGVRLAAQKIVDAVQALAAAKGPKVEAAAEAILTTDTRVKLARRSFFVGEREVTVAGIAKGSGMIAPSMATVLAAIVTDARIAPDALKRCLDVAVDASFHNLVIDGETSTNDAVFALANGLSDVEPDRVVFQEALNGVAIDLARAIAEDGEGATKFLEVHVKGAPNTGIARDLAKAVAGSTLVKAALFGADPNWGRVVSALGARAGERSYAVDPLRAIVAIQGIEVFTEAGPSLIDQAVLRARMREPQVTIDVTLAEGDTTATAWGCDLTYDYVKINADYISFTQASAEGVVSRDDRLTNYGPSFKRSLLVEALSYIAKFKGKRAVIKYGGAAMVKDSLKASFARDVNLLGSAGLLPIVVHGGGPEVTATLKALGAGQSEFIDGVRVTSADDLKVVEMVLSGKINSEIVSLLNQESAKAVGLSGKDGGLLRCKKLLSDGGRDLGMVGEITSVNQSLVEVLLSQQYVPVISPIGLGEDGESYNINADTAAAELATALRADKLIYLTDVAGILEEGELISTISARGIRAKIESGVIRGGMVAKVKSCLLAIDGGVESVHIIDGRTPHGLIAELFTDRGVGTLIVRE